MSRFRIYVVALALVVLALPLVADAAGDDRYSVSITPSAVQPSSSASYTITFKNHPQSTNSANEAHIAIPSGFTIDTPPVATTTCSILPWVATVDVVSSKVDLVSLPGAELCPNGQLAVTFVATASASGGSYEWTTELSGSAGQFALQDAQPIVSVDGTPPSISLTNWPSDPSGDPSAVFGFSANEVVNSFQCSLDGAPFSACSSGVTYGPLGDGGHSFVVRATDLAGNTGSAPAYTWTIDATAPPSPALTDAPQDPSGSSTASFSFLDADSTASFQCQLDGGGFSACSSPKNYSGIGDGSHTFAVKAVDPIGHESGITTYTWTVDTGHPVVTLTDKPPLLTNQTAASFSFSSNKPNSNYQCKLDGGSFGSCTSPRLYTGLGDGPHTFSVRAAALGNLGLTTEYTWIVDTVAPDTAITTTPPASSTSGSANFTFTSSEAGSRFACALDASGATSCDSPKMFSGLGDGAHTFRVQAVDAAGNVDATPASYSWQITGVGPGTTDTTPPGNVKRLKRTVGYGSLKLSWSRPSDSDFDHVEVFASTSAKSLPRTPVYKGKAGRYTNKRFKNGLYYRYVVVSYDHAGNASRGAGAVVPPSILLRSPADAGRVHRPPLLVWVRVAKATYYNVQIYYGPRKILSAWPNPAKLKLSRSWLYSGRHFQLRKGLYRWYVWPAFGPRTKARYGQLLGQATFRVR
jgi:hypothetical protein